MNAKVLFVDDDPNTLSAHQRNFRKKFDIDVALTSTQGLDLLDSPAPYGVIVADMHMPDMSGIDFLMRAREKSPHAVRIMLTGDANQATAAEAVNKGHVYRFLTKPCSVEMLELSIEEGLKHHRLVTAERQLLESTLMGSIRVLADILAMAEPASFGIGQKLRALVQAFVVPRKTLQDGWALEIAALLSQIGFMTIPHAVAEKARKGGYLSPSEKEMLARVPATARDLIATIPRLEPVAEIIHYQQKNYDGTGLPHDAVAGEEIPYGARLLRIFLEILQWEARGATRLEALVNMEKTAHLFDPALLAEVRRDFNVDASQVIEGRAKKEVRIVELEIGQRLLSNIKTPDGLIVVAAGNEVTPMLLQRLRNFSQVQRLLEPVWVEPT